MNIDLERGGLMLSRHDTLGIRRAKGYRLTARRGGLWITQEGDTRDIVLGPGESFVLDNNGLALVTATADACIAVSRRAVPRGAIILDALKCWWENPVGPKLAGG